MPKTKKSSSKKTASKTTVTAPAGHIGMSCGCCHHTSIGTCWMCWLFKSLIFLFVGFLLVWMGFCIGVLKSNTFYYGHSSPKNNSGYFCSRDDTMSQRMSATSLDMMDEGGLQKLRNTNAADFDKEFLLQMIIHHENEIEIAQLAFEKSQNPAIISLAQKIIDQATVQNQQMKELGQEE